jgi:hypothetical protein
MIGFSNSKIDAVANLITSKASNKQLRMNLAAATPALDLSNLS